MELRLARPEEAQGLWDIRNQAVRAGCAQVYDTAAGGPVATGFLDLKQQTVEAIFTLPAYQGRGYAARILARIVSEATSRKMKRLTLSSTPNAVEFYRRQGASVTATRKTE